ncbi:MAG: hypothetical protein WBB88_00590, partial [Methyloceanibacter sp.]
GEVHAPLCGMDHVDVMLAYAPASLIHVFPLTRLADDRLAYPKRGPPDREIAANKHALTLRCISAIFYCASASLLERMWRAERRPRVPAKDATP